MTRIVIDIPDEEYKTLSKMSEKEKVNELSYYERIIANGTPISTEGDLISRSELKKAFEDYEAYSDIFPKTVYDIIDNAPTVDKGYDFGYADGHGEGYELGKNSRPQGEWNYIQAGMCVCPFCGAIPHKLYKNYCAKCGADMRKEDSGND